MKKDDKMKKKIVIKKSNVKGPLIVKKAQSGTGGSKPWAQKTPFEKQATRDSIKGSNVKRVDAIQESNARAAGFIGPGGVTDRAGYAKHLSKLGSMKDADRYGGGLMVGGAGEKSSEAGAGPAKAPCKGGGCKANTTGESIFKSGGKVKRRKAQTGMAMKNHPPVTEIPMLKAPKMPGVERNRLMPKTLKTGGKIPKMNPLTGKAKPNNIQTKRTGK